MPVLDKEKAGTVEGAERYGAPPELGERIVVPARPGLLAQGREPHGSPPTSEHVPWEDAADVLADAAGHTRSWLIQGVAADDAYGTIGARYGVGKSWLLLDLALSVVSGGNWLGAWPCGQGKVCLFYSEGERYEFARRVRAICRHKKIELLPGALDVSFRPPQVGRDEIQKDIRARLEAVRPVLVLIDSFYLSQGGANGRVLSDMGELLWPVTNACQDAGAAFFVSAHWNKSGQGTGADRISGSGLQEWSRIVLTVDCEHEIPARPADPRGLTEAYLGLRMVKGASGEFTVRRRVWSDDRWDLNSKLYYRASTHDGITERRNGGDSGAKERRPAFVKLDKAAAELGEDVSRSQLMEATGLSLATVKEWRKEQKDAG